VFVRSVISDGLEIPSRMTGSGNTTSEYYNSVKLLDFWTLSIIQYSKKAREHNISESRSVSVHRCVGEIPTLATE
jgi:hypothetical protein